MNKCPHCGQVIKKTKLIIKEEDWIWIPELNVYVEKDVHHKNYSWNELKELYGKEFENMLLTKTQVEFLRDHSEYSRIFKLKRTFRNDFYIQQFNEEHKKQGYVAGFYVYGVGSDFGSVWVPTDSYGYRGVRFCRKKISKDKKLEVSKRKNDKTRNKSK